MNDTREFLQLAEGMPRESKVALARVLAIYQAAVEQARLGRLGLALLIFTAWLIPSPIMWIDEAWAIVLAWFAE